MHQGDILATITRAAKGKSTSTCKISSDRHDHIHEAGVKRRNADGIPKIGNDEMLGWCFIFKIFRVTDKHHPIVMHSGVNDFQFVNR